LTRVRKHLRARVSHLSEDLSESGPRAASRQGRVGEKGRARYASPVRLLWPALPAAPLEWPHLRPLRLRWRARSIHDIMVGLPQSRPALPAERGEASHARRQGRSA
jgi:hypothetical protein